MGDHNSLDAFYVSLYSNLYEDVAERFSVSTKESKNELMKIHKRIEREGLSFLTKVLPAYGKCVDNALATSTPLIVPGLQKRSGSSIPMLYGWLIEKVFDDQGIELPGADAVALREFRQLVYLLYKLEIPHNAQDNSRVVSEFIDTDRGLDFTAQALDWHSQRILKKARHFTCQVFEGFCYRGIIPRHGPGAVATGEKPAEKSNFSRLYEEIEKVYPFTDYFLYNLSHLNDEPDYVASLEVLKSGTAKVVLVPKDSRGPRLISCEPLEYQWIQQGLGQKIATWLETHRLTSGHVNFTNQMVNRDLALEGSITGQWVTLDMKEASDRVSLELVKELFAGVGLLEALLATRTTHTKLPNGTVIELKKFAPMGSCLCFPVESFVFYSLIVGALVAIGGRSWAQAREAVFVYGDDIIMRREDYALALQFLPKFGLMFNLAKCCTMGSFRESCGCDAFKGINVTPTKVKALMTRHVQKDASALSSWVSYSNSFYLSGHRRTADFIEQWLLSCPRLRLMLPYSSHLYEGFLGFVRPDVVCRQRNKSTGVRLRFRKRFQREEVFSYTVRPLFTEGSNSGWREMLRRIRPSIHTEPGVHAVPRRSYLQRGWNPIHH